MSRYTSFAAGVATAVLVMVAAAALVVPALGDETAQAQPQWAKGGGPSALRGEGKGATFWQRPASLDQLINEVDFAGAVTVESVAPGAPLPSPPEAPDVAPLPTQVVTLRVEEQWAGEAAETVQVFKTGTDQHWLDEDPPYVPGQVYLLMGLRREDGLLIPYGPEGRIEVRDGTTHVLTDTAVAAELDGQPPTVIADTVTSQRKAPE